MLLLHQINLLRFRNNLLGKTEKLIKVINNKARDEKLQYDLNRETEKKISIIVWKN